ncbi:AzlD domain-containing protein [Nocardia sp. NPDC003345]
MTGTAPLLAAITALATGTFAFRIAGPLLGARVSLGPRSATALATVSVIVLTALMATTALTEGHGGAGAARPAGVLVAGALAWRRVPLPVVLLAAAGTTAGLRLLGVP